MNPPVPIVFRELHRLRRHQRDLQTEIDRGPRVLKLRRDRLAAEEQAHKAAHDALKRLKLKQKDDEGTLKQTEQRLSRLEVDLSGASSNKEFVAKQSEIAQAKVKKEELEDSILTTITEIEERTAGLPAVEKQWADAQAEFATYQTEAKERLARLHADQVVTAAGIAEWEAKLPPDVKPQYDRLVKSYGPDGLAALNGRACQQCRTQVTEQGRANLAAGMLAYCPQCGRGLYPAE